MYHYAGNSPVRYIDPDGESPISIGTAFGIAFFTFAAYYTALNYYKNPEVQETSRRFADAVLLGIWAAKERISNAFTYAGNKNAEAEPSGEQSSLPEEGVKSREQNPQKEHKKPKSGSGKEKSNDIPSWAKGSVPYKGESGKDFSKRLMDNKYGESNYSKGPGSEYSRLKKWGDRGFE